MRRRCRLTDTRHRANYLPLFFIFTVSIIHHILSIEQLEMVRVRRVALLGYPAVGKSLLRCQPLISYLSFFFFGVAVRKGCGVLEVGAAFKPQTKNIVASFIFSHTHMLLHCDNGTAAPCYSIPYYWPYCGGRCAGVDFFDWSPATGE